MINSYGHLCIYILIHKIQILLSIKIYMIEYLSVSICVFQQVGFLLYDVFPQRLFFLNTFENL